MVQWHEFVNSLDDLDEDCDSSLKYQDIECAGPPVKPLEFPTPIVYDCELRTVCALDHRSLESRLVENVLMRKRIGPVSSEDRAYLVRKKVSKTNFGSLRFAVVLKRRFDVSDDEADVDEVPWETTDELVAVKTSCLSKVRKLRGQTWQDPVREIAALQLVGNYHSNVIGCKEVLQDDRNLYTIMPYYSGSQNLHSRLFAEETDKKRDHNGLVPNENEARDIFRQLLLGLLHLQRKGICHRDISLNNLLMTRQNTLKIVDLSSAVRVPYVDPSNVDWVTDVSEGTTRRLMLKHGTGGRLMYLAPELLSDQAAFDGYACDLYSAGICLFILTVGLAPFKCAQPTEKRYHKISRGGLNGLLKSIDIDISPEACDLLQNMLWHDPKNRLTLIEVMKHPWVTGDKLTVKGEADVEKMASFPATVDSLSSSASSENSKTDSSERSESSNESPFKQEARQSASEGSRGVTSKEKKKFLNLPKTITTPFKRKNTANSSVNSDANTDGSSDTPATSNKSPNAKNKTRQGESIVTAKLSPHRIAATSGKQFLKKMKKKAQI